MSEREAAIQEWAEAFVLISAYLIAMATIGWWWIGFVALGASLAAARLSGPLPAPATPQDGETP